MSFKSFFLEGKHYQVTKRAKDITGDSVEEGSIWEVVDEPEDEYNYVRFSQVKASPGTHNYMLFNYNKALKIFTQTTPASVEIPKDEHCGLIVGEKYVPHSKNNGKERLESSSVWRHAKRKNQPFLYYTGAFGNDLCFDENPYSGKPAGDFFLPTDVTPYKETPTTFQVDVEFIKAGYASACKEWKKKLEKKFPELFVPTQTHKIGNRYISSDGGEYLLINPEDNKVLLINIERGSKWSEPINVVSLQNITHEEFIEVIGGQGYVKYMSTTPIVK
jgi:hypothetical protein